MLRLRIALLSALALLAIATTPAAASGTRYGATTLKLDPAAIGALTGLGVAPAPIAPARSLSADTLAFPITNSLKNALRTGVIRHSGGISLTAGATRVELRDFVIDPLRGQLTARVGGARVPILSLDLSRAGLSFGWRSLRLGPVGGSLTAVAAGALDSAFGLPAGTVPPGLKLGDATIRYRLY